MRNRRAKHFSLEGIQEQVQQVEMEFHWWLEQKGSDPSILKLMLDELSELEEVFHGQQMADLERETHGIHDNIEGVIGGADANDCCGDLFCGIKSLEGQLETELKRA